MSRFAQKQTANSPSLAADAYQFGFSQPTDDLSVHCQARIVEIGFEQISEQNKSPCGCVSGGSEALPILKNSAQLGVEICLV